MKARALLPITLLACAEPRPAVHSGASSSSIARGDALLWIASPDDGRVVAVDPTTLAVRRSVAVPEGASAVVRLGTLLAAATARSGEVRFVDDASPTTASVTVPCGGVAAMVLARSDTLYVACPGDDRVVRLTRSGELPLFAVDGVVRVAGRPTALAVVDDDVVVGCSLDGTLKRFRWPTPAAPVVVMSVRPLADRPGHSASQVSALVPDGAGDVIAVYQDVDRDSDRARPPANGSYGSVVDGEPRIEPRLSGLCGSRYARFDGGARVLSGPSALAWDAVHRRLWVVHRYTENVAVFSCDGAQRHLGTFRVGRGPRGITLSEDGRTAWVDVAFDHAVARLALDDAAPDRTRDATAVVRRELGPTSLTEQAMRGRAIFHDAVDTHLTPSGIVTCATCHPDGGDDGLVWFLHTASVGPKLRRTPPAWTSRPSLAPFHWDGEFADAGALTRATITGLMGGDGLLVDEAAVSAWLATLAPPAAREPTADEQATIEAGARVFAAAGCAGCHAGDEFSDRQRHEVLAPSSDPAARLDRVDTPTLRGVHARAPYLHDGRAATLREVLTTHNARDQHGRTSGLSEGDLGALEAYLQTL